MVGELIVICTLFASGYLLVHAFGMRNWGLLSFSLIAGVLIYVCIGSLQIISGLTTSPVVTLAVTLFVSTAIWGHLHLGKPIRFCKRSLYQAAAIFVVLGLLVALFRYSNIVGYHKDSFWYLVSASLMSSSNFESADLYLIKKRMFGTPLIHAPAWIYGELYLKSITPLLALSLLGAMYYFYLKQTEGNGWSKRATGIVGVLMLATLATTNRFVFHSFYLNSHLFVGVCFLVCVCAAVTLYKENAPTAALQALLLLAIPALVVTRPEGFILAGLIVGAVILDPRIHRQVRMSTAIIFALSLLCYYGYVAWRYLDTTMGVPLSAAGPIIIGICCVMFAAIFLNQPWAARFRQTPLLMLAEFLLWCLLGVLAFRDPSILVNSVVSVYENNILGKAGWGWSWVAISCLFAASLVLFKDKELFVVRFSITSAIAVFLVAAYLRDAAYRVNPVDSLTRMWVQLIPLMLLYAIVTFSRSCWRGLPVGR